MTILAASHALIFTVGWHTASRVPMEPPAIPERTNQNAVQGRLAGFGDERGRGAVAHAAAPAGSKESGRPREEFRRLKAIFSGSQINYLNPEGALSEAAALILQVTGEELKTGSAEIARLRAALENLQKSSLSVVERGEQKQIYLINDFSKQAEKELEASRLVMEQALGKERTSALMDGLTASHQQAFFDFGKGDTKVSFEDRGGRLMVMEQKLGQDGSCYASSQYTASELPARYRNLFVIQN